ncbi:glycosyltransferase [Hymenobacter chitinivorans]|uniref:Glycosyltransferase involved in cell wall biosynthesis n=1 Tax=Hymenobacter chitinivorans DSM 11115 TaxID=1121954 RepID=A0A2M9BQT4_9BACT|nr:glycosyltransferase [Hymenobacter chitinivorans]PJJ60316.1 glycosyltransferase involved in cell wall biosynthesis [Hymenobacter chitinivorans DSM 11115]
MQPTTFLLASVLKPLDDTRMYGKFARTLVARAGEQHTVHVAGRWAAAPVDAPGGVRFHCLLQGGRLSWQRLGAQGRYWRLLRQVQPDVVLVHAPELLPLTLLWHGLSPRKRQFLYDVRENYALNIRSQQVYPAWLRGLLARLVRGLETVAARRAAGLMLAERSYTEELPFAEPQRTVVLENKFAPGPGQTSYSSIRPLPPFGQELRLLYSGTISELNGVFEAVDFTLRLRQLWPAAHLTIIGFCQRPEQLQRLRAVIAANPGAVTLIGGDALVPHARVVAEIEQSHLGLLPYRPHPSTWRCVPTKLFEYLANGLPVLVPNNPLWADIVQRHQAGLVVSFDETKLPTGVVEALATSSFYPQGVPTEAFWPAEATKLWALLDTIR